ncbi:MAG TPA: YgeY family selenium metabolism-linked hydrolase [Bacillota bacterium]|jgi:putative selenium metabolism hydrolase
MKEKVVELAKELVRAPSPSGGEGRAAEVVAGAMRSLGYDQVDLDDMGNVVGRVFGTAGLREGAVLFDGHLDTVGVAEPQAWRYPPFAGAVDGGRLYGRGAADMKGAIAAMVVAAGAVAAGGRPPADIVVCATVAEEVIEGPALEYVAARVRPAVVVVGEATDLQLSIGGRGRGEIVVETIGVPAHSSTPTVGVNAIGEMMAVLAEVRRMALPTDDWLGPAIMEPTDIVSDPYPGMSVIPSRCRVTFDRRLMVGETPEGVLASLEAVFEAIRRREPNFAGRARVAEAEFTTYGGRTIRAPKFAPAWIRPFDDAWVVAARRGLRSARLEAPLGRYAFCTNGSGTAGRMGLPTLGFGPGQEKSAHTIDESITLAELTAAVEGYYGMALALSAKAGPG